MCQDDRPMIAERADFAQGKAYLRMLLELMVFDFEDRGGKITKCRPAFAIGCETHPAVRQAIRRDRRL